MKLINDDCIEAMKQMPDNSVDSIVTDPPYGINFMGKAWDNAAIMSRSVAGIDHTQTTDRSGSMHAGSYDTTNKGNKAFEYWTYSWAVEAFRVLKPGGHLISFASPRTYHRMASGIEDAGFDIRDQIMWLFGSGFPKSLNLKDEWQGWGTALKPAHEPMVLARKPINGTVVNNVTTYGTGALNIESARIPSNDGFEKAWDKPISTNISAPGGKYITEGSQHIVDISEHKPSGRWPANVIHDGLETEWAKFFYCAKTSKKDRNEGLNGFIEKQQDESRKEGNPGGDNPRNRGLQERANYHPTVKPTALMQYLIKLITPPNGTVLDPFMGSGSTGKACALEGFDFIGIDQDADYVEIARSRIAHIDVT